VHNVCILDRLVIRRGHNVKHQELNAVSLLVRADVPVKDFLRVTAVRVLCEYSFKGIWVSLKVHKVDLWSV
jgi:hypothetical protein